MDETDCRPPEEIVMDVIYDTFDIPTTQAAHEKRHSRRKRKATDLIAVNPKRIRNENSLKP